MKKEQFLKIVEEKTILLDGGTGSYLFTKGMPRGTCTETWILEHPQVETDLIRSYVEAGSDIIIAPTFGANRSALSRYELEAQCEELNMRLMDLAQNAAGGKAFVAGDIAPTGLILESQGGDSTIEEVFDIYCQQAEALKKSGADLVIAETQMSVDEAVILTDAVLSVTDIPILCTFSATADGCAYYGGTMTEAVEVLQAMGASAVGINCCSGPDQIESLIVNMKKQAEVPIIAKPNAGMPIIDEQGNAVYNMGPDSFSMHMRSLLKAGAGILGGCCGTDPRYIKKMRMMLDGINFIC